MKSKWFLLIKAVISIVTAFFMVFLARTFWNWFLKTPIPTAEQLGQMSDFLDLFKFGFSFFGAMLVGIAIICYFASSARASVLRRNVMLSLGIGDTIGFILGLIGQLSGKFNGLGWILVLLWLVLALGLFYFFFTEQTD